MPLDLSRQLEYTGAGKHLSGCGAVDSALGLGPRGRRFESFHPDQVKKTGFSESFLLGASIAVATDAKQDMAKDTKGPDHLSPTQESWQIYPGESWEAFKPRS